MERQLKLPGRGSSMTLRRHARAEGQIFSSTGASPILEQCRDVLNPVLAVKHIRSTLRSLRVLWMRAHVRSELLDYY